MNKIEEFRKNPEKVAQARALLASPLLSEMLAAMAEGGPRLSMNTIDPTNANILLGRIGGWNDYHDIFQSLGKHAIIGGVEKAALKLQPEK